MRVEIWSDIACPWCYVGKARFEKALAAFPHRDRVEVVHRSFELDPNRAKDDTGPVVPMLAKKYGISEAQAQAAEDNLGTQAAAEGLAYRTRDRDHGSTFDMHRLLHFAKAQGRQGELIPALYEANSSATTSGSYGSPSPPVSTRTAPARCSGTPPPTPTTSAPTSARPPGSARPECPSSSSTAPTASPAPSPPRSSPRPSPRRGASAPR
jgi:hypothetical protein